MANKSHYQFNETKRVAYSTIKPWIRQIFCANGLKEADAEIVADSLVTADARGVYSHGILRTSIYRKRIQKGCVDVNAVPQVIVDNAAAMVVEGNNAMGQVVGQYAMEKAIEKAKVYGISFVSARGSNHYGTCAYYAQMALAEQMIGISATIGGGNLMAPWGGTDARVGNNPFGIAIPAENAFPVVLDMAQSVVAKGKIVMATKTNTPIPKEWAFDNNGRETTDPFEAMKGTVRPIADYKGYGIAATVGFLCSVISDAAIGLSLKDVYEDFSGGLNKGQMFIAIDLAHLTDVSAFKRRMDREIAYIKASPPAKDMEEVYLPGELEARKQEQQMKEGILYPIEVLNEIKEISTKDKVKIPAGI